MAKSRDRRGRRKIWAPTLNCGVKLTSLVCMRGKSLWVQRTPQAASAQGIGNRVQLNEPYPRAIDFEITCTHGEPTPLLPGSFVDDCRRHGTQSDRNPAAGGRSDPQLIWRLKSAISIADRIWPIHSMGMWGLLGQPVAGAQMPPAAVGAYAQSAPFFVPNSGLRGTDPHPANGGAGSGDRTGRDRKGPYRQSI